MTKFGIYLYLWFCSHTRPDTVVTEVNNDENCKMCWQNNNQ